MKQSGFFVRHDNIWQTIDKFIWSTAFILTYIFSIRWWCPIWQLKSMVWEYQKMTFRIRLWWYIRRQSIWMMACLESVLHDLAIVWARCNAAHMRCALSNCSCTDVGCDRSHPASLTLDNYMLAGGEPVTRRRAGRKPSSHFCPSSKLTASAHRPSC